MRQLSSASQQADGLRKRLTDPGTIATAVELLREAGYTELAIWRHFVDAFAVDLDALSLIMKELFGKPYSQSQSRPAKPLASSSTRERARQPRAA
jgi:hypothetical protein